MHIFMHIIICIKEEKMNKKDINGDGIKDDTYPVDKKALPTPEQFKQKSLREKNKQRVTIMLDTDAVHKFKEYASDNGMKYQSLVNDVVATYARRNFSKEKGGGHDKSTP